MAIRRTIGNESAESTSLINLANVYMSMGQPDEGEQQLERALTLSRETGNRRVEASALEKLGEVQAIRGQAQEGLERLREAAIIHTELKSPQTLSGNRRKTALLLSNLGRGDEAVPLCREAKKLAEESRFPFGVATALRCLGTSLDQIGEAEEAHASYVESINLFQELNLPDWEAGLLNMVAQLDIQRGRLAEAKEHFDRILPLIEFQRANIFESTQRAYFYSSKQDIFEQSVGLALRLHEQSPEGGYEKTAFLLQEQALARSLQDLILEGLGDAETEESPDLEETQRLRTRINELETLRLSLLARPRRPSQMAGVESEIGKLLIEYREVLGRVRQSSSQVAKLFAPTMEGLWASLPADLTLISYFLSEERSAIWVVKKGSIQLRSTVSVDRIQALASRVHAAVANQGQRDDEAIRELARLVIGPVTDLLKTRRLAVVTAGPLQLIPFQLLPKSDDRLLLEEHEIINVPSAGILQILLDSPASKAGKTIAVFADPVFDSRDPRVGSTSVAQVAEPAPAVGADELKRAFLDAGMTMQRLGASALEAADISALVPADQRLVATGFEASPARLFEAPLEDYRILHLATHGLMNSKDPELSGLVLSLLGFDGKPQDGFVRLIDLPRLRLNADLVVLSACQTAVGPQLRGEGLLALTRGFFEAGTRNLMASLWQVPDNATAELMRHFYQGLLEEELTPAAALRQAQLAIRSRPRWRHPYFWAGFILQGPGQ